MHVLDESTNIAANLHCLCWSFIWPLGRTISLCILGNFFVEKRSKSRISLHLPPTSGQQYWLKLVAQFFVFDITVLENLRCWRTIVSKCSRSGITSALPLCPHLTIMLITQYTLISNYNVNCDFRFHEVLLGNHKSYLNVAKIYQVVI